MPIAPKNLKQANSTLWLFRLQKTIIILCLVAISYGALINSNTAGYIAVLLILLLPYSLFRMIFMETSSFNGMSLKEILYVRKKIRFGWFDFLLAVLVYSIIYLPGWMVFTEVLWVNYSTEEFSVATYFHKSYGILVTAFVLVIDYYLVQTAIERTVKKVFFSTYSFNLKSGGFENKQRGYNRKWVHNWDHLVNLDKYLEHLEDKCENDSWWPENDFFDPPEDWVGHS